MSFPPAEERATETTWDLLTATLFPVPLHLLGRADGELEEELSLARGKEGGVFEIWLYFYPFPTHSVGEWVVILFHQAEFGVIFSPHHPNRSG